MKMKLAQKLFQKMALTPQMRQSIHILQLPLLELKDYLQQQIEENPALESSGEPDPKATLTEEKLSKLLERREEYKADSENLANALYNSEENEKKQAFRETLITKGPSLQDHLLSQLGMQPLDKRLYKIAELIISHIDENGYLQSSCADIAQAAASTEPA
ncbi:hypothetical protein ACFL1D_06005, partial [Candidatus Omnitrophota bacterium]